MTTTTSAFLALTHKTETESFPVAITFKLTPPQEPRRSRRNGFLSFSEVKRQEEERNPEYVERSRAARKVLADQYEAVGKADSIAILRLRKGMSQQDLADKIKTSQSHIAKIEAGSVKLYFHTAARLADALGVSLDRLRTLIEFDANSHVNTTGIVES